MPPLPSDLRRVLENAVIAAREEATTAAGAALKRLTVEAKDFPPYLTPDERSLRLKLRAAARQLGDPWNADKQAFASLIKLTHEVAYEHWHRMLFARFLAENSLLIHPDHAVPVDLATVAELAQEEAAKSGGKADTWATAGRYAAAMLPQIFRPDDPALAVQLAPEHQQTLETILESLPPTVFTADDSLGWVYQFWQSAEKERVDARVKGGDKITGETLPAVTQLFTEHYMVLFLLHNTVGAWHAAKQMAKWSDGQMAKCQTEADCRAAVALPEYSFDYLRFVKDEDTGAWRPASGTFAGWPTSVAELRVLDPCCGSGHFLVAVLELLTCLRMSEEHLDAKAAALAVIADNLFGLELDARCTQIAAFNVAQATWKLAGEHFAFPELHIACAGLGPSASLEQWMRIADKSSKAWEGIPDQANQAVTNGLTNLHRLFSQAPELGSLIDPSQLGAGDELFSADWETMRPFLSAALAQEKDADAHARAIAAQGMAKAAEILTGGYTLLITNVPFLVRSKQSPAMARWSDMYHPDAKADLATVFLSRALDLIAPGGSLGTVTPQNWYFLSTYSEFRSRLLRTCSLHFLVRLGPNAFRDMNWWAATTSLSIVSREAPHPSQSISVLDVSPWKQIEDKIHRLLGRQSLPPAAVGQRSRLNVPDFRFSFDDSPSGDPLESIATSLQGISTADLPRFSFLVWERKGVPSGWTLCQGSVTETVYFGGRQTILNLAGLEMEMDELGAAVRGRPGWHRRGVVVRQMRHLPVTLYGGEPFDTNVAVIVPRTESMLSAVWAFCSSADYHEAVRTLDQKSNVTNATLGKVNFDLAHWQKVAAAKYPHGLPEPQSDDPTQWLFHGHPAGRVPLTAEPHSHLATVLQVAVARVLGYRWPAELDEKMHLAPEARAWVERCKALESHADDDGVVPLVNINKERPGDERVRALLEAAFGDRWTPGLLNDLLAAAGSPAKSLDEWLKHEFWAQHCALFHQRPFVWQIWDGKKDGFNILVHYHRLAEGNGKAEKLLQKITYTYLGDWITQQQAAAKRGEAGADTRLKAAQDLQKKLEAILAGEPPYDIFVRWKPLHGQPIAWNPDINDGVRVNIRPFVTAGVLRGKVNVKWNKDRGKEPESIRPKDQFPWFWSCPEDEPPVDFAGGAKFTGERLNDLHYTSQAKNVARASAQSK
jgi:hypothetical protein